MITPGYFCFLTMQKDREGILLVAVAVMDGFQAAAADQTGVKVPTAALRNMSRDYAVMTLTTEVSGV